MLITKMNIEELTVRSAEIEAELAEATEERMTELKAEAEQLIARKAELEAIEQRKKDAEALDNGAQAITIEHKKEIKRMDYSSKEYREAWLNNLMGRPVEDVELRTAVTSADAVVPTAVADKIAARLNENALIGRCDVMQIAGYVRIPVYSTNADANWTGTSTDSADAITYIDLKPYQLIKTIEIGAAMDKMSMASFESEIVKILANKTESCLQKAIIVGTGSTNSQPTGIATTVSTATGTFTRAAITKADLLAIMGALPAEFQANACWIMPNKVFFEAMATASIEGFAGVSAGIGYQIGGKPVVVDDNCIISSTDTIFYGDPKHYRLNLGEGVKVDKDLSAGFRSNSAVYRGVVQADGKLDMAAAFVRYDRSAT